MTVKIGAIQTGTLLKDKCVVLTGGGAGIGYAMAKKFSSEGAKVLIAGRNEEKLKSTSSTIPNCCYHVFDISKAEEAADFIKQCENRLGKIDCLVNNAGISLHESSFEDVTIEGFDQQFSINYRGTYFLSKAFFGVQIKF